MAKKFILNIKNKQIAQAVHLEEAKESPVEKSEPVKVSSLQSGLAKPAAFKTAISKASKTSKTPTAKSPAAQIESSQADSPQIEEVHVQEIKAQEIPLDQQAKGHLVKEEAKLEEAQQEEPPQEIQSKKIEKTNEVDMHLEPSPEVIHSAEILSASQEEVQKEEAQKAHLKARSKSVFVEESKSESLKFKPKPARAFNEGRPYESRPYASRANESRPYEQKRDFRSDNRSTPAGLTPKAQEFISPHSENLKEAQRHKPPQLPPITESKFVKLGPTGKHVKDLLPPKSLKPKFTPSERPRFTPTQRPSTPAAGLPAVEGKGIQKKGKKSTFKEYEDLKASKAKTSGAGKLIGGKSFSPTKLAGAADEEGFHHRKRRHAKVQKREEIVTIRPDKLKIRTPISVKDLAVEMKLKASQLIAKLFLEGVIVTINDYLEDLTTIELLGHEFGCAITIDNTEQERIRITSETIQEEIEAADAADLVSRAPVVAFMGHVDHGKTSLIDRIRSSNRTAQEAGAITQHIGAFFYETDVGPIAILDTPGHEAFSAMRARGANVTDIVVLVVAGDEGIRQQTDEAIQHAKAAGVSIVVAINKCDKPNFNAENIYRQLAERDLLPEAWGGHIITINCSAITGEGIQQLLEMLALQAEVMELKANPKARARGTVLESEMHKGMGAIATVIIQNGTLKRGDSIVFEEFWGRIKTMRNEYGQELTEAGPSCPVEITGLSGLPEAGQEFIMVSNEKEAKEIAQVRLADSREKNLNRIRKRGVESFLQDDKTEEGKKVLNVILRADMQGSLEALKTAVEKISSDKVRVEIVLSGVGEVSESDIQLAAASNATIIGFHTQIESHAESLMKEYQVNARIHDIIYHALDDIKALMKGTLDKLAQEIEKGKAEILATFKSSQVGTIAGCKVIEGTILRNHRVRIRRKNEVVWTGAIASIKRHQDDVREVQKGFECGIVLSGTPNIQEGDILEAFEIIYISQEI